MVGQNEFESSYFSLGEVVVVLTLAGLLTTGGLLAGFTDLALLGLSSTVST